MAHRRPLFPGDSEIDQIFKIFQILGTPNDLLWNGAFELPYFKMTFPKWMPKNIAEISPNLDENGLDLLKKMVALDPCERISAREALNHVK